MLEKSIIPNLEKTITPVLEKKKYICLVDRTGKNLFMRLVLKENTGRMRLLKQFSVGQLGIKGPKKRTTYSAEVVGKKMGEYLKINNITYIEIYVRIKRKKRFYFFRYAIRPLRKAGVYIARMRFFYLRSHNGSRPKRKKRR